MTVAPKPSTLTDGAGAAAILAASIAMCVLSAVAIAGEKSARIKDGLTFYKPTGPLSGVTIVAVVVWLMVWAILHRLWSGKTVDTKRVIGISFVLLGLSLLLVFPPFVDLL